MAGTKSMTLTVRVHSEVKEELRAGAERERRSLATMIEVMIRHYFEQAGLRTAETGNGTQVGQAG